MALLKKLNNSFVFVLLGAFLAFSSPGYTKSALAKIQKLEEKSITVGIAKLTVERAKTPDQQQKGLMFRKHMPSDHGMIFEFGNEEVRNFWMKNTFIPLSIGFFNANKELIDIQDMTPVVSEMQADIPSYQSTGPAKYALEVNLGWFKKNKVKLGNKLNLD